MFPCTRVPILPLVPLLLALAPSCLCQPVLSEADSAFVGLPRWAQCEGGRLVSVVVEGAASGELPPVTGLTALRRLTVRNGRLSGGLPDLSGLAALEELNLSRNIALRGDLAGMRGLRALDVSVGCLYSFTSPTVPVFSFSLDTPENDSINPGNPIVVAAGPNKGQDPECNGNGLEYLADDGRTWVGSYAMPNGANATIGNWYVNGKWLHFRSLQEQQKPLLALLRGRLVRIMLRGSWGSGCLMFKFAPNTPGLNCSVESVCGDGVVHAGTEECDDRSQYCVDCKCINGTKWDGRACAPIHGDGILLPGEECEKGGLGCDVPDAKCESGWSAHGSVNCSILGRQSTCDGLGEDRCATAAGCQWCESYQMCLQQGTYCQQCAGLAANVCTKYACEWCDSSDSCTPASTCSRCSDYKGCGWSHYASSAHAGCTWCEVASVCSDGPATCQQCSSLAVSSSCTAPCAWCGRSQHCLFDQKCTACAGFSQTECSAHSSCRWCQSSQQCGERSENYTCGDQCQWCDTGVCTDARRSCPICQAFAKDTCGLLSSQCSFCGMASMCQRQSTVCLSCAQLGSQQQCESSGCVWTEGFGCSNSSHLLPPKSHSKSVAAPVAASLCSFAFVLLCLAVLAVVLLRRRRDKKRKGCDASRAETLVNDNAFAGIALGVLCDAERLSLDVVPREVVFANAFVGEASRETVEIRNCGGCRLRVSLLPPRNAKIVAELSESVLELDAHCSASVTIAVTPRCSAHVKCSVALAVAPDNAYASIPVVVNVAPSCFLDFDELQFGEVVGQGCYGKVSRGEWKGQPVALKEVIQLVAELEETKRETDLLSRLRSPYIVTYFGSAVSQDRTVLVMELAEFGSLGNLVHNKPELLTRRLMRKIACDICQGMAYLHASAILHRDLKTENVLVFSLSESGVTAKVSDFGMSRMCSDVRTQKYTKGVGTPAYIAPEVLSGSAYSVKVDVYGFAMILWEMETRQRPYTDFRSCFAVTKFVCEGNRLPVAGCRWGDVIQECWAQSPEMRPTVQCRVRFRYTEVPTVAFNATSMAEYGNPLNAGRGFVDTFTNSGIDCTGTGVEYLADNGTWVGSYTDLQGVFHPTIENIYAQGAGVFPRGINARNSNIYDLLRGRTVRMPAAKCGPTSIASCIVFRILPAPPLVRCPQKWAGCGDGIVTPPEQCEYNSPLCQNCLCINGTVWNGVACDPIHGDGILVPGEQCERRGLGCNVKQATCETGWTTKYSTNCSASSPTGSCDSHSEATCGTAAGCRWCESYQMCLDSGAYCEACTELAADTCASYTCTWCDSSSSCSPSSTCVQCDSLERARCGDFSGCAWSYYASSCVSREAAALLPRCASLANHSQCAAHAGCTWCEVTASCWDGPSDCEQCSALATAAACAPPCAWCNASSHCLFQQPCTACAGRTASECAAGAPECSWCGPSQVCEVAGRAECRACSNATGEGECAASPGCRWCSSNASCADAGEGFAAACLCHRQQRDTCGAECRWCESTQVCSDVGRSCPICLSFAENVCRNSTACAYCDLTAQCTKTTTMCVTCDKIGRREQCLAWKCHWNNGFCYASNYTQPLESSDAALHVKDDGGTRMAPIYAGVAGGVGSALLLCVVAAVVVVYRRSRSAKSGGGKDTGRLCIESLDAAGVMSSPRGTRTAAAGPVDKDAEVVFAPREVHVKRALAMSVVETTVAIRNLRGHPVVVALTAPECSKMAVAFSSASVELGPRKTAKVSLYLTPKCSAVIRCCAEGLATPGTRGAKLPIVVNVAPSCFLDMEDVEFGEVVGQGCYGKVSRGRWKGQAVALKEVIQLVKDLEETRREIDLLSRLRSPYVVTFYGTAMTADRTVLVMDLKAENVLVFSLTEATVNAKVSDFGTSRMGVGTPAYVAPEVLEGHPYSVKVDVYGFALVLWELETHRRPYDDFVSCFAVTKFVCEGQRLPLEGCAHADIIQACWAQNPADRPSFDDLLKRIEAAPSSPLPPPPPAPPVAP
eukprot:m51a1_g8803 putative protein serine threonine (1991) ;mRNA; f:264859-274335